MELSNMHLLTQNTNAEKNVHDMMLLGLKPKPKYKMLRPWVMKAVNYMLLSVWWGLVIYAICQVIKA